MLALAWYGPRDGAPCVVLSGMPGPRLAPAWAFPEPCWPTAACACWVSTAPAMAIPSPNPQPTALGVAENLGVLFDAVGLERVAVLGISVGAPFALACAVRWPQRVGALLLSSPMCPWVA